MKDNEMETIPPALERARLDGTSIFLHWMTVALITIQFATAWLHETVGHGTDLGAALLEVHRSFGAVAWTVTLARLVWRSSFGFLPPFPANMPRLQQWMAKTNEYGLYALLLAQPLTGIGETVFRGRPFTLFMWQVPPLLKPDIDMSIVLLQAHKVGAAALMVLIGMHAGAALFHALVLRDGVVLRILPRWSVGR